METTTHTELGTQDFTSDPHAAKYQGELDTHPEAFEHLFALLNDPANEQRLIDAEMHDLPALCGIVRFIEADPAIARILKTGSSGFRFRQTVGVAVKLKMTKLGWRTTGRKGTAKGAKYFAKAEHYVIDSSIDADYAARASAALATIANIGGEDERERTGRELLRSLSTTRQIEGRAF